MLTKCWTSTSSGLYGDSRASMRRWAIASWAAAASTSSRLWVGTSVTREGRPGAWPERPARCISRATPLAEPICSTRSTGRKSTPRSRLEVHTTALSCPSFNARSTQSRVSRDNEPWCRAIKPAQSGRAPRIAWYQISDCARVLVNTRQLLLASTSATTCGNIFKPICPAQGKRSVTGGSKVSTFSALAVCPCTLMPPPCGTSTSKAWA